MGVEFGLMSVVSCVSKGGFTLGWVNNVDTTGGVENIHLSSLRNVWGDCRGVTGRVFSPSSKGQFEINSQQFHSAEQWILLADTPMECKGLSYKINGVDHEKWHSDGYEICFVGIHEKFMQNQSLLQLLKTTSPKTLAEATTDKLWGTGIALWDSCALQTHKWHSSGWLSRMLMMIRDEP